MASVYAGRLSGIAGFQRLVAIKIIHSHLAAEDEFIKMFLDEARLSAGIQHPNVGEVFEVGEDDGLYYMVSELILGQSLRAVFRRAAQHGLAIPHTVCARVASNVCSGLHAAHELKGIEGESLGLVHRDVSPRNILLTYDGFVKLIDFGVAYAQGRISQTDVGTLKGKIGYMSPEQLRCEPLDRRSDIFSLGVMLYQIVTGKQPFNGMTDMERLKKIMQYQFDIPSTVVRRLDPLLEGIILKAMAWYPEDRYKTAVDMAADLNQYIRRVAGLVESSALSKMMNSLFQAEHEYHLEKVRECQKKERDPKEYGVKERDPREHGLKDSSLSKRTQPALPRAIVKQYSEEKHRRLRRLKKLSIGLLAVSVVFGLSVWGITALLSSSNAGESSTRDTAGEQQTASSSAAVLRVGENHESIGAETPPNSEQAETDITSLVSISLSLLPSDAGVSLDGIVLAPGTNELLLSADGAPHRLQISAEGYLDEVETVTADRDKTLEISLVQKVQKTSEKKKKRQRQNSPRSKKNADLLEASPYR